MKIDQVNMNDRYKKQHFLQYRDGTEYVSSYIEARGSDRNWDEVVFCGLNYHLQEYMSRPLVTERSLERMERRFGSRGIRYPREALKYILENYSGMTPVRIQALEEGSVVPLGTPLLQVVNTDPKAAFVTSYIETALLRAIWYPTTVATLAFHIKKIIQKYMLETAGHTNGIEYMLHDFGPRGASSSESAQIGGLGHLTSFRGTDNDEALEMIDAYYGDEMAGESVEAAEHSTVTSYGGPETELEAYDNLLDVMSESGGPFSIVSDTYNIYEAVSTLFGQKLKTKVIALGEKGSKLVVRPDSGDPVQMVSDIIERLMEAFGYTLNQKGYKVLPPYVGVIQGDGINEESIEAILAEMKRRGLSAENVVFGMGGALLQGVNRDTLKFAQKASAIKNGKGFRNNEWYGIQKQPITDSGKRSKFGRQAVIAADPFNIVAVPEQRLDMYGGEASNLLIDHYVDGRILKSPTIAKIRERVASAL